MPNNDEEDDDDVRIAALMKYTNISWFCPWRVIPTLLSGGMKITQRVKTQHWNFSDTSLKTALSPFLLCILWQSYLCELCTTEVIRILT